MDIRRRTTYLSRGVDGRPSHNYSSFFQSAQKKYCNADPESGIRLVGPMFELTACVELKGDEEDFETMYPDTSLSFGPTICSFGLKYNDHNYALPSGLTPPSMAPHLMDLQVPKNKFSDTKLNNPCSKNLFAQKSGCKLGAEDIGQKHNIDKRFDRQSSLTFKRSTLEGNGMYSSDGKKHSSGLWYSKSIDLDDKSMADSDSKDQYMPSRFGSQISNYEQMELRCEPELKVIEVPEELAVSPSQLSDLDSDTSEVDYIAKIVIPSDGSYIQPAVDNAWVGNNVWADVRCVCGHSQPKSGLIRCPKCSTCQHVQCMESYYNVTMPRLSDGYTCNVCGNESTEFQGTSNQSSDTTTNANANKDCVALNDDTTNFIDAANNSSIKLTQSSDGNIGAQYVEVAADRAKRLGLLSNNCKLDADGSTFSGSWSGHSVVKEHDTTGRSGWSSVNWEKLNEISRSGRRHHGDTDVNLRMPSPPRASKRKQDLTSTSYNDTEVATADSSSEQNSNTTVILPNSGDESSSVDVTPSSTPSNTPMKPGTLPLTPVTPTSTPGGTLTPGSGYSSSSGVEGSPRRHRLGIDRSTNKVRRVLFPDGSNSTKRRFDARTNPLGAAWAKDYQEAENNVYTKALLERIQSRISASVERNHKIPPACLTRSSLCRVVLFDHNDKGLEASIRLAPNEVVTEVRGHFLLMEEYEHYVDPVSDYNRYVMFYRGFGDRTVVIDSGQYGNSARFVRRSCIPNCRLEHYVVQNKLKIVIRTSVEVMPGTELTIPFDLDYRACRYPLDCACARSRCPVLKWRRKLLRNKVVPNLDYSKYIESQLRVLSKPLSQESPTNRSFDSSSLTASPLVKTSATSNSAVNQPIGLSPNINYNLYNIKSSPGTFRKEVELPIHDCDSLIAEKTNQSDLDLNKTEHLNSSVSLNCTSSSTVINQCESSEHVNLDLINSESKNVTESDFVTDENQIPETSQPVDISAESNSRTSSTKIKDTSFRKNQNTSEEKLPFEPIITTRRQAAAMKNILR
ncbi:unnamed protein product [Schistosoma spindalis]|nr:unnamed protein product [Schistosoma spindale]